MSPETRSHWESELERCRHERDRFRKLSAQARKDRAECRRRSRPQDALTALCKAQEYSAISARYASELARIREMLA